MTDSHITFLLQAYRRLANMQRQLDDVAAAPVPDKDIILTNNNNQLDILKYVRTDIPMVTILQQTRRRHCGHRFEIARETDSSFFVSLDDDLFLAPDQIATLVRKLLESPDVPHGVWGQNLISEDDGRPGLSRDVVRRKDCPVDVLNRAYAFTKAHVTRFFELLRALGFSTVDEVGSADDILLSFSGSGRPRCHDLGVLENCPTSNMPGIALWKEDTFYWHRVDILDRLRALGAFHGR